MHIFSVAHDANFSSLDYLIFHSTKKPALIICFLFYSSYKSEVLPVFSFSFWRQFFLLFSILHLFILIFHGFWSLGCLLLFSAWVCLSSIFFFLHVVYEYFSHSIVRMLDSSALFLFQESIWPSAFFLRVFFFNF